MVAEAGILSVAKVLLGRKIPVEKQLHTIEMPAGKRASSKLAQQKPLNHHRAKLLFPVSHLFFKEYFSDHIDKTDIKSEKIVLTPSLRSTEVMHR